MNTQAQTVPADIFRRVTGLSIGLAVLMIVLGFAAMFKPFAAGLGISLFIAWIIVFAGVVVERGRRPFAFMGSVKAEHRAECRNSKKVINDESPRWNHNYPCRSPDISGDPAGTKHVEVTA